MIKEKLSIEERMALGHLVELCKKSICLLKTKAIQIGL